MSENITPEVEEVKPVKTAKAATPCACASFFIKSAEDGSLSGTDCTAMTVNTFGPGHDAKLKSLLIKAGVEGATVVRVEGDVYTDMSAVEAADEHGFASQVEKSVEAKRARVQEVAARRAEQAAKREQRTREAEEKKAIREAAAAERKAKADQAKAEREAAAAAKKAERAAKKVADAEAKAAAKAAKEAEKAAAAQASEDQGE